MLAYKERMLSDGYHQDVAGISFDCSGKFFFLDFVDCVLCIFIVNCHVIFFNSVNSKTT